MWAELEAYKTQHVTSLVKLFNMLCTRQTDIQFTHMLINLKCIVN